MKKYIALILIMAVGAFVFSACDSTPADTTGSSSDISDVSRTESEIVVIESDSESQAEISSKAAEDKSEAVSEEEKEFPASGYCAVGIVNKDKKTVSVLSDTGVVKTIKYSGDAPIEGIVYPFEYDGNTISLTMVDYFPPIDDEQYAGWELGPVPGAGFFYGGSFLMNSDSAVFVRYSATEWRVFKGDGNIIKNEIQGPPFTRGYLYNYDVVHGEEWGTDTGTVGFAMIVGDLGKIDSLPPATAYNTSFLDDAMLGWSNGNITITED